MRVFFVRLFSVLICIATVVYAYGQQGNTNTQCPIIADPHLPITFTGFVPTELTFEASSGEHILFFVELEDIDRDIKVCPNRPADTIEVAFPILHEVRFICLAGGVFVKQDPNDPGTSTVVLAKVETYTNNKKRFFATGTLIIDSLWTGTSPINVLVQVRDLVPNVQRPNTGTYKDSRVRKQWMINTRMKPCPTSLSQIGAPAQNTWHPSVPAPTFSYQAEPVISVPRPNYAGVSILESFQPATALGFTMNDVDSLWKVNHPRLITPDLVASQVFPSGNNGTFVFFSISAGGMMFHDIIQDVHSGFASDLSMFTPAAFQDSDGVGYSLEQKYSCQGNIFATATIERKIRDNNMDGNILDDIPEIRKVGP